MRPWRRQPAPREQLPLSHPFCSCQIFFAAIYFRFCFPSLRSFPSWNRWNSGTIETFGTVLLLERKLDLSSFFSRRVCGAKRESLREYARKGKTRDLPKPHAGYQKPEAEGEEAEQR